MDNDLGKNGSEDVNAYYRVSADVPLRITRLDEHDVDEYTTEVLSYVDKPIPEMDPALIGWLDRIERKLDRILARDGLLDAPHVCLEDHARVELSAVGIGIPTSLELRKGDAALVEFELPEVPVRLVRCIGRVVGSDAASDTSEPRFDLGFETIRQSDRDAVVRYTLVVQRQTIRGKAANRVGAT